MSSEPRMDIKARVPKRIHDLWRTRALSRDMSINQFTKAVILDDLGELPFGFWGWDSDRRVNWLRGK